MNDNDATHAQGAPEQGTLPLETGADEPIGYAPTARARRQVAPDSVPDLAVVAPAPGALTVEPGDTRPARARALRRAGTPVDRIARELDVEELLVEAWCGDIGDSARARLRVVATRQASLATPKPTATVAVPDEDALAAVRTTAREEARRRLTGADAFVGGLGLAVGRAEITPHAATIPVSDRRVAAATVRWLIDEAGVDPRRLRIVLRLAPELPADLTVGRWAASLGLPTERVVHSRWRTAPHAGAVEALIRVADGPAAARLAGWRDALLGSLGVATDPSAPDVASGS